MAPLELGVKSLMLVTVDEDRVDDDEDEEARNDS